MQMKKIAVLGLAEERSDLLKSLLKLGVVTLNQTVAFAPIYIFLRQGEPVRENTVANSTPLRC